ncbi:hypothetical protein TIFTF001_016299 [Ficus carica]|uniref:Uncharacterized protein n=1 Tax=Ficus carica TaxID=3494 RepID=A0AA88A2V3_FICCA|nr:hypothetical protein TIFTF001_016299 [Ficus carica]
MRLPWSNILGLLVFFLLLFSQIWAKNIYESDYDGIGVNPSHEPRVRKRGKFPWPPPIVNDPAHQ